MQSGITLSYEGQKIILSVRNPHVVPEGLATVTSVALRPMGLQILPPWLWNMPMLSELQLEGNPLEHLVELPGRLTRIEARNCKARESPRNLPESLTYLDLSCNQLSDPGIFENLPSTLRVLILQDNRIPLLPKRFPLRILTRLVLDFNGLTALPNGLPNTLQHLSIIGNRISELPDRLPLNLRVFLASSNELTSVDLKTLVRCEELTTLDLAKNSIKTLEAGFLPSKLQSLKLNNNGLRLSEALIIPSSLRLLNLSNNDIDDIGFLKFSGSGILPPLRFGIDRAPYHNQDIGMNLARVRRGFYAEQEDPPEGLIIVLSSNPALSHIPSGILPRQLTDLQLDCCGLQELPSDLRHTTLEFLSAEMNHLTALRVDDLPSSLISLGLSKNHIGRVIERSPCTVWHRLVNLRDVSLRDNLLESLPRSWLSEMSQLRSLDVCNNALKHFPQGLSVGLTDLMLSDNLLRDLGTQPLPTSLRRFCLARNLISSIAGPALLGVSRHLTTLQISENNVRYVSPDVRTHLESLFHDEEDPDWGGLRRHHVFDHFPLGNVYTDPQIVHRHEIQESIRESILRLVGDEPAMSLEQVAEQLISTRIAHRAVKNVLIYAGLVDEDSFPTTSNSELTSLILPIEKRPVIREQISLGTRMIDFADILRMTWSLVNAHSERATIIDNLEKELNQEVTPCITGLVDSLVSCLAVFDERVSVKISDADQLAAVIEATGRTLEKQGSYTPEEHRRLASAELIERGLNPIQVETWVSEIA